MARKGKGEIVGASVAEIALGINKARTVPNQGSSVDLECTGTTGQSFSVAVSTAAINGPPAER